MKIKKPGKQPNKFLTFTSIGIEIGVTIYLSVQLGKWLDSKYSASFQTYTLICTVVGFVLVMYILIKKLNNVNR